MNFLNVKFFILGLLMATTWEMLQADQNVKEANPDLKTWSFFEEGDLSVLTTKPPVVIAPVANTGYQRRKPNDYWFPPYSTRFSPFLWQQQQRTTKSTPFWQQQQQLHRPIANDFQQKEKTVAPNNIPWQWEVPTHQPWSSSTQYVPTRWMYLTTAKKRTLPTPTQMPYRQVSPSFINNHQQLGVGSSLIQNVLGLSTLRPKPTRPFYPAQYTRFTPIFPDGLKTTTTSTLNQLDGKEWFTIGNSFKVANTPVLPFLVSANPRNFSQGSNFLRKKDFYIQNWQQFAPTFQVANRIPVPTTTTPTTMTSSESYTKTDPTLSPLGSFRPNLPITYENEVHKTTTRTSTQQTIEINKFLSNKAPLVEEINLDKYFSRPAPATLNKPAPTVPTVTEPQVYFWNPNATTVTTTPAQTTKQTTTGFAWTWWNRTLPATKPSLLTTTPNFPIADSGERHECGKNVYMETEGNSAQENISSAVDTRPNEFPWQVRINYQHGFVCSGTVISSRHVLTAAHCIISQAPHRYELILGDHNRHSYDNGEKLMPISKIFVHPAYSDISNQFDLAVMETADEIIFDKVSIRSVCLPNGEMMPSALDEFIGAKVIITGWGKMQTGGGLPSILQKVSVPLLPQNDCIASYRNARFSEDMMCSGANDLSDTCLGDSGGPLLIQSPTDGRYYIQGVTSWGYGCARPNFPGVHARVASSLEWINRTIV